MIKTQIIKEDNKPIAVIIDYFEYKRLKDSEEDRNDYLTAVKIKKQNKKWIKHEDLKKELKIK
jgi:hypothetical protein